MALFESREETQIHLNVQEGKLDFFKKKNIAQGVGPNFTATMRLEENEACAGV
jgi:hypothetical protein